MRPDQLPTVLQSMYSSMKGYKNIQFNRYEQVKQDGDSERQPAEIYKDAQVVSSEIEPALLFNGEKNLHYIALDIDMPAVAIESSTPGHTHLYIGHAVPWEKYKKFIKACVDVGIVEEGYLKASQKRKATFLRLPWVKKGMENLTSIDSIEEFLNEETLETP